MAWSFNKSDLSTIGIVAGSHPDPEAWWIFVASESTDPDLTSLANAIVALYAAGGPTEIGILEDIRDDIHAIAGLDVEFDLSRIDETSQGETVTYQVSARGVVG